MCRVRDGSEESLTMQTLHWFLFFYCLQLATVSASRKRAFTLLTELNDCCVHNAMQCDLQVLFLTHLLLYHYITVYHFHFEIYLARSTMPSYLWHISALKTSIREGGQMALVPGVIIIIPRSRHFVTSAGVSVCARTRTIWRWPLRHPGLDNLNNNFTPSRSFKTIFFRSRVYICHSTAGEHHLDVVHMCQNVSGTN